jgi:nucleotide-binding universal stress UspA family protein
MKTIVVGYDESPEAGRALERSTELAKALGARVVVASVAPILQAAGHSAGPYDPSDPPERHREVATAAAAKLTEQGVTATAVSGVGDAGDAIVALAGEHDADLIVVGMSHHPHIARWYGGVSEDVAHNARCDVLLVH